MVLLVPVVIITLTLLANNVLVKANVYNLRIGDYAVNVLKLHDEASKDLLFLDLAAEKAAVNALYRLAQNKVLFEKSCGTIKGVRFWNDPKNPLELCFSSVNENYKKYLTKELNKYLQKKVNYEYYITDDYIYGIALDDWKYDFILNNEKKGEYTIKPSFRINFPNKINSLEKLRIDIKRMLKLCSYSFKTKELLDNCVNQFDLNYEGIEITRTSEKNNYFFDVNAAMDLLNGEKRVKFNFAIKIPYATEKD